LENIVPGENARVGWEQVDDRLKQLAESIQMQGMLEPLLVREIDTRRSESSRIFRLLAGFRRYRAAQYLNLPRVPVRVIAANDAESIAVNLAENLARGEISDAEALHSVEVLHETYGWGARQIARATGKSASWVSELLTVARSRQERAAVEAGQMGVGTAVKVARLKDVAPETHATLLARLDAGERVELREVPRVRQITTPILSAPSPQPISKAEGMTQRKPEPLQLSIREQALYRNMYVSVRTSLGLIDKIWVQQGRDRTPPEELIRQLELTRDEIDAFLARAKSPTGA
ncbi:MAG TPA: ParB/RepB/Spo0J family partition protein, partial [Chloroflexota bacterium]|nr:ParB/RepB/Spo0J family partition protein [Chloroflexota bacterium]